LFDLLPDPLGHPDAPLRAGAFQHKNNLLAAADILLCFGTLIWAMVAIYPRLKWVALANIPYLAWVAFAAVLQFTITYLNW